ncbi:DUF4011 domain-containing protein [Ponticaulis sp.]|uniref:DUF4011 domain-containing protein n=1 Tax=Ponticaulis sp. TaxID=2020902 RepID=UPI000B6FAEF6|nr:DUF4011 domain-containing protein [Ponticaulis sp.]MAJ09561.1 hypothetical protein [Ponticaulis sp.]RPG18903.1 MAG: DUF4011 domain-containing protein [Hyphomonadaceae bacterium TMED125]
MSEENLEAWVRQRIEALRPRLLDLTRRNPLISAKLSPRSTSYVRVVDELPDVLSYNLANSSKMRFVPLPSLDDEPLDEDTNRFKVAYSEAQRTDVEYNALVAELNEDDEVSADRLKKIERALKDRVREELSLPKRELSGDVSLPQHAKLHGVAPDYELPFPTEAHDDGRHEDDAIQTLLLPDQLERKLTALTTKCNTWIQETGINVLHGAFGLLEWRDAKSSTSALAPLVLLPVEVSKTKTQDGPVFWINGLGEPGEANLVLAEMLKRDFDVDLPSYDGGSVEEYLKQVAELKPKNVELKVRRQVVFGVFPSARMAMYHDLDPDKTKIHNSSVVAQLLGGKEQGEASPFADEHDVESPEVEKKIPLLVTEADSSQLSVLVDMADGRSLAVEGPPGTGKSQTIVNAIASSIANGKKVLFVAEKMAALEVVKARLQALGLGEFILPLQAERSSREQVISSIRERLAVQRLRLSVDYDEKLKEYRRLRELLNSYVDTVAAEFGATGLTVYEVLGKSIATANSLEQGSEVFLKPPIEAPEELTQSTLSQVEEATQAVDLAVSKLPGNDRYWSGIAPNRYDKIELDEIRRLAKSASEAFSRAASMREKLQDWAASTELDPEMFVEAGALVAKLLSDESEYQSDLFAKFEHLPSASDIEEFFRVCEGYTEAKSRISRILRNPDSGDSVALVTELLSIIVNGGYDTCDVSGLSALREECQTTVTNLIAFRNAIEPLQDFVPGLDAFDVRSIGLARRILDKIDLSTLRLRTPQNVDDGASEALELAIDQGIRLKADREAIETDATIPDDLSSAELLGHAREIDEAGLFGFLSSDVQRAKRVLRSIMKHKKLSKKAGADLLRKIADWKVRYSKFASDTNRALFGMHFDGVDSNFEAFSKLVRYLDEIEHHLQGAENRALRDFLRNGESSTLMDLPSVEVPDANIKVRDLASEISNRQDIVLSMQRDIDRISTIEDVFFDLSSVKRDELSGILETHRDCFRFKEQAARLHVLGDALGHFYSGVSSDVEALKLHWKVWTSASTAGPLEEAIRAALVEDNLQDFEVRLSSIIEADKEARLELTALQERSGKDFSRDCDCKRPKQFADILEASSKDIEGISACANVARAYHNLGEISFGWVPRSEKLEGASLRELLMASIYRAMSSTIMERYGNVLNRFSGMDLNEMRQKLATLDREILKLSRKRLRALALEQAKPTRGRSTGRRSEWTELSLIENEVAKQKRFVAVRDLVSRAGRSLQELKPCWMMSPLAVAQFLPASGLKFDICIIDEASQMKPEDALGALARADQAMVVGDVNQLPPSSFFQKMVAEDDDDNEDASTTEESILEIANARFRPNRRLRWHYRSEHSELIRFSNEIIYDRSLVIFPSANEIRSDMGVSLVPVKGLYRTGVNPIEAKEIVAAAIQFMRTRPEHSLGIVTLNQKQRDLIIDEMNFALEKDEKASQYVDYWKARDEGLEQFFIKNLENVQGDERDVIFIGTVYGPEVVGGRVAQRFGPVNGSAGRRRLNVLFSRAKKQIVTFSSLSSSDITADENSNPGTHMLKRWLEYSATKILEQADSVYADTDSDFEDFVIAQIRSMGCEAVPQVGAAGYRIDIGVKHPDWPYGFILAVECDGATYHSCRSARDRDRLRQEVLERLGWRFHRIWSTDWFNDPRAEAARLRAVIDARLEELKSSLGNAQVHEDTVVASTRGEDKSGDLFEQFEDDQAPPDEVVQPASSYSEDMSSVVEVGDTIRVRYLNGNKNTLRVKIVDGSSDVRSGILGVHEPLSRAVLGAELGGEVEVLIGSYVRTALIEAIEKAT